MLASSNQSWARDNVVMFSGQKMVDDCLMSMFGVATPFRHRSLKSALIFSKSLMLCYMYVVACPALLLVNLQEAGRLCMLCPQSAFPYLI